VVPLNRAVMLGQVRRGAGLVALGVWPLLLGLALMYLIRFQVSLDDESHSWHIQPEYFSALAQAIPIFFAILLAAIVFEPTASEKEFRAAIERLEKRLETGVEYPAAEPLPRISVTPPEARPRMAEALARHGIPCTPEELDMLLQDSDSMGLLSWLESAEPGQLSEYLARPLRQFIESTRAIMHEMGDVSLTTARYIAGWAHWLRLGIAISLSWNIVALATCLAAVAIRSTEGHVALILGGIALSQAVCLPLKLAIDHLLAPLQRKILDAADKIRAAAKAMEFKGSTGG
jgi:hypothetical protein